MYAEEKLKIAMLSLLEAESFDNISVTKVCLHSNVSRPTFYHHYTSLADLAIQSLYYSLSREVAALDRWEDWLAHFSNILSFINKNRNLCANMTDPCVRKEALGFIEQLLKKAVRRQETLLNYHLSAVNEQFVAHSYAEIYISLIQEYLENDTIDPGVVVLQCEAMLDNAVNTSIRGFMRLDQKS